MRNIICIIIYFLLIYQSRQFAPVAITITLSRCNVIPKELIERTVAKLPGVHYFQHNNSWTAPLPLVMRLVGYMFGSNSIVPTGKQSGLDEPGTLNNSGE